MKTLLTNSDSFLHYLKWVNRMMSLGLVVSSLCCPISFSKKEWSKERDVSGWPNGLQLRQNQNQSFDGGFITLNDIGWAQVWAKMRHNPSCNVCISSYHDASPPADTEILERQIPSKHVNVNHPLSYRVLNRTHLSMY